MLSPATDKLSCNFETACGYTNLQQIDKADWMSHNGSTGELNNDIVANISVFLLLFFVCVFSNSVFGICLDRT